ncbi:MAG: alpha/beta fold hydrolase [Pseudomonadota bacterium]
MSTERPCLYLLCGLLCDEEVWRAQADALRARHDVRVVSFEDQDSIGGMAAKVLADAPPRFALAGHSMGGRVALEVCRLAPQRVERLALLDTGYEGVDDGEPQRRALLVGRAQSEGIDAIARAWGLPMLAPAHRRDGALVDAVVAMVGRMSAEVYAGQTRALLGRPDATAQLAHIAVPTLVLCGQQDGWSPPARHQAMAAMIPGSELRLIDDCGHMAMMEQPAAVLQALEEWLAPAQA